MAFDGKTLRTLRTERGLSLRALGQQTRISHVTLSYFERGARSPSFEQAEAIARALGVTLDALSV